MPLTPDQHFTLVQMVHLGRQKLDEMLAETLEAIRPPEERAAAEPAPPADTPPDTPLDVPQS